MIKLKFSARFVSDRLNISVSTWNKYPPAKKKAYQENLIKIFFGSLDKARKYIKSCQIFIKENKDIIPNMFQVDETTVWKWHTGKTILDLDRYMQIKGFEVRICERCKKEVSVNICFLFGKNRNPYCVKCLKDKDLLNNLMKASI